jgi:hypothetical protein
MGAACEPVAGDGKNPRNEASIVSDHQGEHEIENLWINAFAALGRIKLTSDNEGVFDGGAVADPDAQPLVDLLRSDMPMPPSARDTLAELLSPGDPSIDNWKLVPERIKRIDPIAKQLDGNAAFEKNISAGMTAEVAADQTGIRGGRQINRYRKLLESLGRRLHGQDSTNPR